MIPIALVLIGTFLTITAFAADLVGIGGQPGLGLKQILLAIVGSFMVVVGLALRTSWFRNRPPVVQREILIVLGIIFLGGVIRTAHLVFIDIWHPLYLGGLFVEFGEQIVAHNYLLPQHIPFYTDGGIPFAYPPLPFYIEAIFLGIFSMPKFPVINVLPVAVSLLTLPSFYVLTQKLKLGFYTRLTAFFAYAIMPAAYQEQIVGAGLAEVFGTLAMIWFTITLVNVYQANSLKSYGLAGLLWGLCVVASPGSAYGSVVTMVIFSAVQLIRTDLETNRLQTFGLLSTSGFVAVAVTSPYWLTVIANHGIQIFTDSVSGQHRTLFELVVRPLRKFSETAPTNAAAPFLWNVSIFAGLVGAIFYRRWALLAWFIALYLIPREGGWLAAIPATLLVGIGITEIIWPLVSDLGHKNLNKYEQGLVAVGFGLFLIFYLQANFNAQLQKTLNSDEPLSPASIAAMEWIGESTPEDSKFIVLSDENTLEWMPQVARRTVLNTPYGAEWEKGEEYKIKQLNERLNQCNDFECISADVANTMGHNEVFILLDGDRYAELQQKSDKNDVDSINFAELWRNEELAVGHLESPREVQARSE